MHWQDWVISIGSLLFTIALFPSIKAKDKPALLTSLMTGTILGIFAIVYVTLALWFSAFTTLLTSVSWLILAWQKINQKVN